MNVGIFADCYIPTASGVVTSAVQLREGLERRGHRAIIVTVDTPPHKENDGAVYRFPSIPFNKDADFRLGVVSQGSVNRILERERIDLIHTHTEFSVGWAAKRAARLMNLPLVHTAHTLYEDYRHYLFLGRLLPAKVIQTFLGLYLSDCDALICPSAKAVNYFRSVVPDVKTVVIGNGVCKSQFRPVPLAVEERDRTRKALGIRVEDKVILYVGRMGKEKRVRELFTVLVPLLRREPHYKALFVGCGPCLQQVARVAKQEGLSKRAILPGHVDWRHVYRYYSIADVFATASLSEVHPMTLIEASMCGLPIVARRDEGYAGLVQDGCNGYLADLDSQLAERLGELLEDDGKRLEFSKNGLMLSDRHDSERHVERIESLYHQIVNKSSN
jgi:1,2-diacylglycerol 3-alpha-glucosyltransferase